jgi:hypothetical protein
MLNDAGVVMVDLTRRNFDRLLMFSRISRYAVRRQPQRRSLAIISYMWQSGA